VSCAHRLPLGFVRPPSYGTVLTDLLQAAQWLQRYQRTYTAHPNECHCTLEMRSTAFNCWIEQTTSANGQGPSSVRCRPRRTRPSKRAARWSTTTSHAARSARESELLPPLHRPDVAVVGCLRQERTGQERERGGQTTSPVRSPRPLGRWCHPTKTRAGFTWTGTSITVTHPQ
jgi:hypothetical protein